MYSTLERDNQETAGSHGNTTAFDWLPNGKELIFWSAGQFHRVDVATGDTSTIPIRVKANLQLRDTVRFPVEVSPASFNTKMLRWAQQAPDAKSAVFQALGHLYRKDLTGDSSAPPTRLTRQTSDLEYWPSLTADGRSVVYSTWNDKTLGAIKKVSSRGGKPETLTAEPGHYVEPRFSPDGKQIVLSKDHRRLSAEPIMVDRARHLPPGPRWLRARQAHPLPAPTPTSMPRVIACFSLPVARVAWSCEALICRGRMK